MNSRDAYHLIKKTGVNNLALEDTVSKDGFNSLCYAAGILKSQFKLGEESISKDGHYSYNYAKYVLKSRFNLGESAIANCYNEIYLISILGYNHE